MLEIDFSIKIYASFKYIGSLNVKRNTSLRLLRYFTIFYPRAASTGLQLSLSVSDSCYSSRGYSFEGTEKILPPGSPYSSHGSPLRIPMSSGHGSPQDSPHVVRHRRDSEHSSGAISRRGSSDVVSPLPEGHPLGSPDSRGRRRADYSPHQGRFSPKKKELSD